jgi:hypothetical protein
MEETGKNREKKNSRKELKCAKGKLGEETGSRKEESKKIARRSFRYQTKKDSRMSKDNFSSSNA